MLQKQQGTLYCLDNSLMKLSVRKAGCSERAALLEKGITDRPVGWKEQSTR